MPPAFSAAQYSLQSLHLYRSLLRECSYLPDLVARREIARQVKSRFRRHDDRGHELLKKAQKKSEDETVRQARERLANEVKKAEVALATLRKANYGAYPSLRKVLLYAYGRTGRRRHELLRPLLEPDDVETEDVTRKEARGRAVPKASANETNKGEGQDWSIASVPINRIFERPTNLSGPTISYRIASRYGRLKALADSQSKHKLPIVSRAPLKTSEYKMPSVNSWERAMPRKRVRNNVKRWYGEMMSKMLPPLPAADWDRLQGMVQGSIELETQRPRRPTPEKGVYAFTQPDLVRTVYVEQNATLTEPDKTLGGVDFQKSASKRLPVPREVQYGKGSMTRLANKAVLEKATDVILENELGVGTRLIKKRSFKDDPHIIKPRYMQRLLASVFSECPSFSKDAQSGTWEVQWGRNIGPRGISGNTASSLFTLIKAPSETP